MEENIVRVKAKKVFHIDKDTEFVFEDAAAEVKEKVQKQVKEWAETRGFEESD